MQRNSFSRLCDTNFRKHVKQPMKRARCNTNNGSSKDSRKAYVGSFEASKPVKLHGEGHTSLCLTAWHIDFKTGASSGIRADPLGTRTSSTWCIVPWSTYLPDRASGPDAVSAQLLKSARPTLIGTTLQAFPGDGSKRPACNCAWWSCCPRTLPWTDHSLIHTWPGDQLPYLEKAWQDIQPHLQQQQYPRYYVRGPMAAAVPYLREWNWQVDDLMRWHRNESQFLPAANPTLRDPWWKLELAEAQQQRTDRLANRPHHHHFVNSWDSCQLTLRHGSKEQSTSVRSMLWRLACLSGVSHAKAHHLAMPVAPWKGPQIKSCQQSGLSASLTMTRIPCGRLAGYHWNHKTTNKWRIPTMDMDAGRHCRPRPLTNTKDGCRPFHLWPTRPGVGVRPLCTRNVTWPNAAARRVQASHPARTPKPVPFLLDCMVALARHTLTPLKVIVQLIAVSKTKTHESKGFVREPQH